VCMWYIPFHLGGLYSKDDNYSHESQSCGMCFYRSSDNRKLLLIARKDGSMSTLNVDTKTWNLHGNWAQGISYQDNIINPATGSCVAVHPTQLIASIGTTKGDISLVSIPNSADKRFCSSKQYLAIQSLCWIDEFNLLAFHVKGIVVWWTVEILTPLNNNENTLSRSHMHMKRVLNMSVGVTSVGVPMCHYHDKEKKVLFIGDSRGNIAMFDCKNDSTIDSSPSGNSIELFPTDVVVYAHKKEHVTAITSTSDGTGIFSIGNDGRLQESTIVDDGEGLKLHGSLSRPISNLTGLSYIWHSNTQAGTLIVGGYHGNDFVMINVATNYQLLRVNTGGRSRRLAVSAQFYNGSLYPFDITLAICVTSKKGPSEILIRASSLILNKSTKIKVPSLPSSLGVTFHGETVLDVELCSFGETILLASGSNDCSVKLSTISENSSITLIKELPPHETCIRALCFSRHEHSSSALLVVCGGKLITTFYRIDEDPNGEYKVHFLCNNKFPREYSMDHRINAVKAIPLFQKNTSNLSHLVLAGDSDGGLHLTFVMEVLGKPRRAQSHVLVKDSRPILCIDMVRITKDHILSAVGTTAGEVNIWIIPEVSNCIDSTSMPTVPLYTYTAHQVGTDCINLKIIRNEERDGIQHLNLLICSGGDDQAISLHLLEVLVIPQASVYDVKVNTIGSTTAKEACASAIKGIHVVGDSMSGYRMFATGYDQRLSMWNVVIYHDKSSPRIGLKLVTTAPVDVKDINALSCCTKRIHEGEEVEYLVAGGEGLDILSFHKCIWQAAAALKRCNYLLITTGAGFSADSGLSTYETMPEEYRDLCDTIRMVDSLEKFQDFWIRFAKDYTNIKPHQGYSILEKWCGGRKLRNLKNNNGASKDDMTDDVKPASPFYVYTSNVDGHFGIFDCFKNTLCEIHGRATEFRCAQGIGYNEGMKRKGDLWDKWNHDTQNTSSKNKKCRAAKFSTSDFESTNNDQIIKCKVCNMPARPNVLMFHDTDENVLNDISSDRGQYQRWEELVENEIVENGQNLVVLELGAGVNVPAVREESEEVYTDVLKRLQTEESRNFNGSVTLIRINPKDSNVNNITHFDTKTKSTISIPMKAEHALLLIDQILSLT